MRASDPNASRFDALRWSLGRLFAGLLALALLICLPFGGSVAGTGGDAFALGSIEAAASAEADARVVVLPTEAGDKLFRVHHRLVGTSDPVPPPTLAARAVAPVRYDVVVPGVQHRSAFRPLGRGPPAIL